MTRNRPGRRARVAVALLVAFGLTAAACGSDDDSSSEDTAGGADTETTAAAGGDTETTAGGETETTAAGDTGTTAAAGGESAAGIDLDAAKAIVDEFSVRPTEIPNTAPIEGEIPTGKSVYFISCGAPACEAEIPILQEAADILGWELTAISTDPTKPEQIPAAWDRVVNEKPDALLYTATPISQVQTQFDAAVANGTVIAACCTTDPPGEGGLSYVISTPDQTGELGKIMAAWVVNDAAGEPAHALYLDLPDFPILSALRTDFEAGLSELCEPCTSDVIEFGLADLAEASDQVVSYLRANPDVKYVIQSTDSTFSLPAALEAAGLEDIRIFGEGPTSATLADIDAGRQAGTMAFAFWENMFSMMDSVARTFAGDELEFPAPPNWILTAGTFPTGVDTFPLVEDVVDQYKALWGKS